MTHEEQNGLVEAAAAAYAWLLYNLREGDLVGAKVLGDLARSINAHDAALQAPQEEGVSLHEAEERILQEYRWGNLTKLGVANHLRRAGFKHKVAVDKANALSQPEAQAVPEGWKLVPIEPTVEMIGAFWRQKNTGTQEIGGLPGPDTSDFAAYRAMLAASPATGGA